MGTMAGVHSHGQKQQGGLGRGDSGGVAAWQMRWRWAPGQFWKGLWAGDVSSHKRWCLSSLPWNVCARRVTGNAKLWWPSPKAVQEQPLWLFPRFLTLHSRWATHRGHIEVSGPRPQVWEVTCTAEHRSKKPFEMTLTQMTLGLLLKERP